MNKSSAELFGASLGVFENVVSPEYNLLRQRLNDQLSVDHAASLEEQAKNAAANFSLMAGVVARLPLWQKAAPLAPGQALTQTENQ